MPNNTMTTFPKVSIITCVYNGEKYIGKLMDSVLHMGYPNIEHIIVDDGSTDSTEKIVNNYSELYSKLIGSNLYVKYIKQSNMGLGGATNTGLKEITGDYWTWINCDDWYEPQAFFEPIEMLLKNQKIDYVQMNGFYCFDDKKETIIDRNNRMAFNNKYKLFVQYRESKQFKWLLYICRTSSFRKINPTMSIYPSRYTQDDQLISMMFGVLNGSFCFEQKWNFLQHSDSYQNKINNNLLNELSNIYYESIKMINVKQSTKNTLNHIIKDSEYLDIIKTSSINNNVVYALKHLLLIQVNRFHISFPFWIYLNHKQFLYLIFSFFPKCLKNRKKR